MPHTRSNGMIHGLRPGTADIDADAADTRANAIDRRDEERRVNLAARRANSAYGNLDLDKWTEQVTHARKLILPPGGRPRKAR